jgi:hypothetical protein
LQQKYFQGKIDENLLNSGCRSESGTRSGSFGKSDPDPEKKSSGSAILQIRIKFFVGTGHSAQNFI